MFNIVIKSTGLDQLPARLNRFRAGVLARVPVMLNLIGQTVAAISKVDYLSGPRSSTKLGVVSGDLRRSIGSKAGKGGLYRLKGNTLEIGTNLPYGRAHEFGFSGTVQVAAHSREVKVVFGRYRGFLRQNVQAHSRKMRIPPRPFLNPALKDAIPEAQSIIKRMVDDAMQKALR